MKPATRVCSSAHVGFLVLTLLTGLVLGMAHAQNEPILVPEAVDYQKLLPVLPEPPLGWTAEKPEGSTEDVGGFRITNVHRDYHKGEGDKAPAWNSNSESSEGYSKSVTIDGNPGFEAFEKETKHATLWLMIANRYFVQVELQNQDPAELQEWVKRVDLKKLAEIK